MKAALARETIGVPEPERRAFLMANLIAGQLGYRFVTQFIAQLSKCPVYREHSGDQSVGSRSPQC